MVNQIKRFTNKLSDNQKKLVNQILRFFVVGCIATLIDFIFLYIFKELCNWHVILANTLSFTISVIYNYLASVKWVFNVNKKNSKKRNFILFILFSVIGLLINDFIMWIAVDKINIYYLVSKVIATAIVMVYNFVTRKLFLE